MHPMFNLHAGTTLPASVIVGAYDDTRNNPNARHWPAPGRHTVAQLLARHTDQATYGRFVHRAANPNSRPGRHTRGPQTIRAGIAA